MRGSWLSSVVAIIRNNFTNLFDLLSFDVPDDTYATTLLLLWLIFSLLGRVDERG